MNGALVPSRGAKLVLGLSFLVLAALDTVLIVLCVRGLTQGLLGGLGYGPRIIVGILGVALAWFVSRQTFRFLVKGEAPFGSALDGAIVLGLCTVMTLLALAFLGPGTWILFAVALLALFLYAVVFLWSLAGPGLAVLMILSMAIVGVLTWMLT
jgi:hypothetical protein